MGKGEKKISPDPLFRRLGQGGAAAFAASLNVSEQRVSNWKRRGVPSRELPRIAREIGITVEDYLREAGQAPSHTVEQPKATYLDDEAQALLSDYTKAAPAWKLTLRLLAKLAPEKQAEAAATINKVLVEIPETPYARTPLFNSRHGNKVPIPDAKKRNRTTG